jgi:hypothetical protein
MADINIVRKGTNIWVWVVLLVVLAIVIWAVIAMT